MVDQAPDFSWNTVKGEGMGSGQRPKGVDFADIVDQSEQPPLYIHFPFGTEREAVHVLVHTEIGKDRLDNSQPSGIDALALFGVDLGLHFVYQIWLLSIHLNGKIPARGGGLAQTL